jgi:hypothetical protein
MFIFNGLLLRPDPAAAGTKPWGLKKSYENPNAQPGPSTDSVRIESIFKTKRFWQIGCPILPFVKAFMPSPPI